MPKTNKLSAIHKFREVLCFLTLCTLCATLALGQTEQDPRAKDETSSKPEVGKALARLKEGTFSPLDLDLIATLGAQALPYLRRQFGVTTDEVAKDSLASALVRLGDKEPGPWDYLVQGTTDAIVSDAPSPQRFDGSGKAREGASPEYLAWAKAHNLTVEEADDSVMRNLSKVVHLGETRDLRAVPLLRQALLSRNYMIATAAAVGLAELQDKASIPLIIQTCKEAPADAASAIAGSLLHFNDPQAQAAAKEFRPEDKAK